MKDEGGKETLTPDSRFDYLDLLHEVFPGFAGKHFMHTKKHSRKKSNGSEACPLTVYASWLWLLQRSPHF